MDTVGLGWGWVHGSGVHRGVYNCCGSTPWAPLCRAFVLGPFKLAVLIGPMLPAGA